MKFIDLFFPANSSAFFATEDGGTLRVVGDYDEEALEEGDGEMAVVRMSFALGMEERQEDIDCDLCHCLIRLADSDGTLWEAKSVFTTDVLLGNLVELDQSWIATSFDDADESLKEVFQTGCLLEGIIGSYDDRAYHYLRLGEKAYDILFKYQYPRVDVAVAANRWGGPLSDSADTSTDSVFSPPVLLVRVSEFMTREAEPVPAFVHYLPCEKLMFYTQTSGLPETLVFKKIGTAEASQPMVQYVPHAPFSKP